MRWSKLLNLAEKSARYTVLRLFEDKEKIGTGSRA